MSSSDGVSRHESATTQTTTPSPAVAAGAEQVVGSSTARFVASPRSGTLESGAVQSSFPVRTSLARSERVESPVSSHRIRASPLTQARSVRVSA